MLSDVSEVLTMVERAQCAVDAYASDDTTHMLHEGKQPGVGALAIDLHCAWLHRLARVVTVPLQPLEHLLADSPVSQPSSCMVNNGGVQQLLHVLCVHQLLHACTLVHVTTY